MRGRGGVESCRARGMPAFLQQRIRIEVASGSFTGLSEMRGNNNRAKCCFILALVAGITVFQYVWHFARHYSHVFLQDLYFLPLILASFWFGLRGAIATSLGITLAYLPFVLLHWKMFSPSDFERLLELLVYNIVAGVVGMMRDRERQRQKHLLEAKGLAAMGEALSGVAHDMKTPLIAIGGFTRMVQRKLQADDPNRERLTIVIKETHRLENMVKEMLDFARPLELHLQRTDLNALVRESLAILDDIARDKHIQLREQPAAGEPFMIVDEMRLKQVLINLVTNAIQSSPSREEVLVRSYRKRSNAIIEVSDHGPGIPQERRHKVFEPFFTTKKEGTGLGLPIVQKIVEAHEGQLEILDNTPKGLTFKLTLPRAGKGRTAQKGDQDHIP